LFLANEMADHIPKSTDALGRYQLLTTVARGGMGQVWLGRLRGARGFHKLVAIKTLLSSVNDLGRFERMLLEEARIAALIHHPNVVQTIELGEQDGTLFLVMEWVDGESLGYISARAQERGGMPLRVSCSLIAQVLRGLHAAHELCDQDGTSLGVVHRDVSPHNVLVTYSGVAKLVDFGIAKATNQRLSDTMVGEVKGKVSHMAPEQVRGDEVDRRTDLFAMGIMLYTLTCGRHPFKCESSAAVLHSIVSSEPVLPPSSFVRDYPAKLEAVVLKALQKDPARRFQTAEEMRSALERALPARRAERDESDLKAFLAELLAERATSKRELLRDAQQAADGAGELSPPAEGQGRSESGSSLRALSIDHPDEPAGKLEPPPSSPRVTLPGPRRRALRKQLAVGIAVGMAVALALVASGAGLHSLLGTQPTTDLEGVGERAPAVAASPVPQPVPVVSTPPSAGSTTAPPPSASASTRTPDRALRGRKPVAPRPPRKRDSDELIPPDYAR
jgi:eukaryotic-like serine/threonine-protein kinase